MYNSKISIIKYGNFHAQCALHSAHDDRLIKKCIIFDKYNVKMYIFYRLNVNTGLVRCQNHIEIVSENKSRYKKANNKNELARSPANFNICALCMLFFTLIHLETYCCPTHKHILHMQYKSIHFPSSEQTPKIFLGYAEWESMCVCVCMRYLRRVIRLIFCILLMVFRLCCWCCCCYFVASTYFSSRSAETHTNEKWKWHILLQQSLSAAHPTSPPNQTEIIPKSTNNHWDLRSLTGVDLRNDM